MNTDEDKKEHDFFRKLMAYMNEYKHHICYDSTGLINLNARYVEEDDILE